MADARLSFGLPNHPKTKKLIRRVGYEGAWRLACLILWAGQNKPDGDFSGMSDEDIEIAVDWQGKPGDLMAALVDVRFIDGEPGAREFHDWMEHQPYLSSKGLRSNKAKLAGLCSRYGQAKGRAMFHAGQARSSESQDYELTTSQLVVNSNEKSQDPVSVSVSVSLPKDSSASPRGELSDVLQNRFDRFWAAYPKRRSKGDAAKAWKKLKPSEQLLTLMLTALERAKTSRDWMKNGGEFIPHPATWLNAKGWEDEHGSGGRDAPTLSAADVFPGGE